MSFPALRDISSPLMDADRESARHAAEALSHLIGAGQVRVVADADGQSQSFILPTVVLPLLRALLTHLAEGCGVTVLPTDAELTAYNAADLLNVSNPHLTSLLREGKLPHRMVGTQPRIRLHDLLAYCAERDAQSDAAMDRLVAEGQAIGVDY